jgi:hypothetical protein
VITFAGDERFGLFYVVHVVWKGIMQREWESASVFITGNLRDVVYRSRGVHWFAPPPPKSSISVCLNVGIDNLC